MKRFLFIAAMAAVLAITALSMASSGGGIGVGVVPSMTLQVNSLHPTSFTNNSTVMSTQNFKFSKGVFSFTMIQVDPSDKTMGKAFNGQISFTGSASAGNTALSNVFMNLSGLMLNPSQSASAAIGSGTVNGTMDITQSDSFGNSTTVTPCFKGSYNLKAAFSGSANGIPTSGTISSISMVIPRVGMQALARTPNFNNSTSIWTYQIEPLPVVLNTTIPSIPFNVVSGSGGGNGSVNLTGLWDVSFVWNNLACGGTTNFDLTQSGNVITGTKQDNQDNDCSDTSVRPVTGSISGSKITFWTSGGNTNVIISGTLNSDGTVSSTVKCSNGDTAKGGMARAGSAPVGVTGSWAVTITSQTDPGAPTSFTDDFKQYGGVILGTVNSTIPLAGTISGQTMKISFLNPDATTTNVTGTINGTMVSGAYPSGTTATGSFTSPHNSGNWTATKN